MHCAACKRWPCLFGLPILRTDLLARLFVSDHAGNDPAGALGIIIGQRDPRQGKRRPNLAPMRIGMRESDKGPPLPHGIERHHLRGRISLILPQVTPSKTRFAKNCRYLHEFALFCIRLQKIASPQKLPKN